MDRGEDPRDTTDPAPGLAAVAVPPAWGLEAEVEASGAAVGGAGERFGIAKKKSRERTMKSTSANGNLSRLLWIIGAVAWTCLSGSVPFAAQQSSVKEAPSATPAPTLGARSFDTPQRAADALVAAAEKFDEAALIQIFGPDGEDIVFSGELAQDRQHAADFAGEAHEKKSVSMDPKSGNRAFLLVGNENWPFPVPIVKRGDKWYFDANAGR